MCRKWIAAALLLCSTFACAEDKPFVAIHGFDKMSCDEWFGSDGNAEVRQQYIAWIRGVVTGYNYANPEQQVIAGRMPSDFGLIIFVDNYCHSRRATSVAGAAFALIADRRGGAAVQVLDDGPKSLDKSADKSADKSKGNATPSGDPPGFREWLARQSADIKSLGPDLQKNIYEKEAALRGN
jgi:hypothetical protein